MEESDITIGTEVYFYVNAEGTDEQFSGMGTVTDISTDGYGMNVYIVQEKQTWRWTALSR